MKETILVGLSKDITALIQALGLQLTGVSRDDCTEKQQITR